MHGKLNVNVRAQTQHMMKEQPTVKPERQEGTGMQEATLTQRGHHIIKKLPQIAVQERACKVQKA